jgi:hypothetical protein
MTALTNEAGGQSRTLGGTAVTRMVVAGALGWALAALFIRYANGARLFAGAAELGLFALCFPVAWGTALLLRAGGRLRREQIVPAMSVGVITALFLDGIALTTAPWIYGATPDALLPAAAWLLFGVGTFLAAAFLEERRG